MDSEFSGSPKIQEAGIDAAAIAAMIAETQLETGEIPWHPGHKTDPWDHVESAMGLTLGGWLAEARRAFEWLRRVQLGDGGFFAAYQEGKPADRTRDANFSTYLAVGLYHYFLITGDTGFLASMWNTVSAAMRFALSLQGPQGEIYWALSPSGEIDRMALLTGSSSIYMSLKCALAIAEVLGRPRPSWVDALHRLADAIRNKPYLFNITKSRYSMDWYYPVLAGALTGRRARQRLERYWKKFVIHGQGVKCVFDAPWVTIAETCELAMALAAMGNLEQARIVLSWIGDKRYADGSYWCGFTYPEMVIWPENKITWTNAVALLAADSVYQFSAAGKIFSHRYWNSFAFTPP